MIQIIMNVLLLLVPQYKWKDIPLLKAAFVSIVGGSLQGDTKMTVLSTVFKVGTRGANFFTFPSIKLFSQE